MTGRIDTLLTVGFRGKADVDDRAALTTSVVDDPTTPFAARDFCSAN
jgi:hypothetical protein